jgi:hypothetical protein
MVSWWFMMNPAGAMLGRPSLTRKYFDRPLGPPYFATMAKLHIRLTRISNTRHRFEAIRPDGGVEVRELETRSFFLHDLVHFAVESEARLRNSFYGQLGRGAAYDDMASSGPETPEGVKTEMVVGALQGAMKAPVDPESFVHQLHAMWANIGREPPDWLTPDTIAGVLRRLRVLQGLWRATPFGKTLELEFPVD